MRTRVAPATIAAPLWHTHSIDETVRQTNTSLEQGLTTAEAGRRLQEMGPNEITTRKHDPWWEEIWESLTEPLVLLLVAVAVLYGILGELADALTILFVILTVAGVEMVNESRAKKALNSLRDLSAPSATVIRENQVVTIPTVELVPGDVVLLQPGERAPADLRLTEAVALRADESSLTGESISVAKDAGAVTLPDAELGDRRNLVFAGTVITSGNGRGVVVSTGRNTELGRIAGLVQTAREPRTPLQVRMRQLAGWLLWVAVAFSVLVPVLGYFVAGRPWREMLLTGLTIAFATIPEELPIFITIVLGIGAFRLTRQHAIIKPLRSAETMGSVSVIGTDKTGTLTENRMKVAKIFADGAPQPVGAGLLSGLAQRTLQIGVLANDAQLLDALGQGKLVGDPTEVALLAAAGKTAVANWRRAAHILEEYPFDDIRKRMSVVYEQDGERWVAVKGAPESILSLSAAVRSDGGATSLDAGKREQIQEVADAMAARGLRVLAFAERRLSSEELLNLKTVETDLTWVGLAGMEDPPRPEAAATVAELQSAGVRVLMLTGDHPGTALAIARRVGIDASRGVVGRELENTSDSELRQRVNEASVFARITPEHKLRVVRALQSNGEVVAVTGDGVNDAPALREASIGVAMGRTGTDVAREAAGLVLADDNLATLTTAVRVGRLLYENLHKAVRYYLAAKVGLIVAALLAVLFRLPVPFSPIQIIVLELFMDLGASVTFTVERPESDLMRRPPRSPQEPFINRAMLVGILAGGWRWRRPCSWLLAGRGVRVWVWKPPRR
jgi:Ca2+-transporting ATPase